MNTLAACLFLSGALGRKGFKLSLWPFCDHDFSGHSNHSCDTDVFSIEGIHFGFLQTWAQENNWAYWRQPSSRFPHAARRRA